jgi:hypothetical protein
MCEIWKPIDGFFGMYEVSNKGRVKALERTVMNNGGLQRKHERILRINYSGNRRGMVVLCKNGKTYPRLVHRLVATAFIPNPDNKPVVDHIDTNVYNNHVENLRWATVQENCLNPLTRINNSKSKMGHPFRGRKLTDEERAKISDALRGKKLSEEHRRKLSEGHKNSPKAMEAALRNLALIRQRQKYREES